MSVSPRENLKELLDHRPLQWIPFTLDVGAIPGFTKPIMQQFLEKTGTTEPAEYFNYDFRTFSLRAIFGGDDPNAYHVDVAPGTTFDEWGIGHGLCPVEGTIGKNYPPLARAKSVSDIEAYPTPVIDDTTDLSPIVEHKKRGFPVFGYAGSIYEWSWWLRGMEKFLTGMILEPDVTEVIITKVADHTRQLALASARSGIDVLCFYDDVGMQTGMQISTEMWRRFIKPKWRKVLDDVRSQFPDVRTFLHSCGNIREIIPDIVELGFDILHPIQPECMDFAEVKREYGQHITLCATISSQQIFPFGTSEDVRREVRRLKKLCGADRRCILCPSNLIQPETPWDNILAFAEEARAHR
ncbi:MAG: hypothetical protein JSV03_04275 [Planctomycetota bacterium]|nr:MAG: hypothetical protein JSV03_04275 [Planctomycetota bacterium]